MKSDIIVPIHEAIGKEAIIARLKQVGPKGLSFDKANELGVIDRISNLLCAMHSLVSVSQLLFEQTEVLFDACRMNRHEIKKSCVDFKKAYDRWFTFWNGYQTVDGEHEMDNEVGDLYEQFMRWAQLPIVWNIGDRQDAPRETEPMIEIVRGDRVWRVYRDTAESDVDIDDEEEWAVMRSDRTEGFSSMTCVERGLDRGIAFMSAKRMSANDKGRLYTASRFETLTEKRLDVVPYRAFLDGDVIGDVKRVIKK